jgi:uncharacterized coiled-coil protein SlyX
MQSKVNPSADSVPNSTTGSAGPALEARLTELELRYMNLSRTFDELSDVVADQGRTIAVLLRELTDVTQRLKGAEAPQDRPPHY